MQCKGVCMIHSGIYLETERLLLIPMSYDFVSRIIQDDSTVYLDLGLKKVDEWPEKADIKDILELVRDSLKEKSEPDGFDAWLFVNKVDMSIVGDGGFKGNPDEEGNIDLGYAIIESQRQMGLAYEAASALLNWGLSQAGVNAVTADCLQDNVPSVKILSKLGMEEVKREDGMIYFRILNK